MHERELKVLARGGLLLAVASVVRLAAIPPASEMPLQSESVLDSLLLQSRVAQQTESRQARPLEPGERIDPNTADAVELSRLPGIGPALASRIVAERTEGGAFRSLEDLTRVRGIGTGSINRLSESVRIATSVTPRPVEPTTARSRSPGIALNLNRATAVELQTLQGVGPVLAARIVRFRSEHGSFKSSADLIKVPGIGVARLKQIQSGLADWGGGRP